MPLRSLMYCFILDTTIRMSLSVTASSGGAVGGRGGGGVAVRRRGGDGGLVSGAVSEVSSGLLPSRALRSASSAAHSLALGARASTAHASRWRSIATWLSQQATLQNTSRMRARLQVDTLHT